MSHLPPSTQDLYLFFERKAPVQGKDAPTHLHSHYELLLSIEAVESTSRLEGRDLHMDRPFVLLMSPFCEHRFTVERPELRIEIHFGNSVIDRHPGMRPLLSRLLQNRSSALLRPTAPELSQMTALCRQMQMLQASPYACECVLEALLYLLSQHLPAHRTKGQDTHTISYIADVVRYIASHLSEKLTAPILADAFFVSRDKLNRDFKQYTSVTLGRFISSVRLERARELLESRDKNKLSIKEISEACGFESDVYFYSFFKQSLGVTPKQYEEEYRRTHSV